MARPFAVVTDPIHEDGIARLQERCEIVRFDQTPDQKDRDAALERAEVMVIRSFPVDAGLVARTPRLRAIGKHGSGVDNVDIPALTRAGVAIANTPGGSNSTAVAEGAVTLMLAVLRHVFEIHQAVKEGRFALRFTLRGGDLWERTVGIIGIGNIGTHVARICGAGFKMRVLAYDPYLTEAEVAARGATKVATLEELLAASDVVTLHSPLTPETKAIIDARAFAAMKPTAVLVNTSRGPTVDPTALYDALANKRIRGAGIDVFDPEPPEVGNPLLDLPNIVLGAHTAGLTEESTRQMAVRTVDAALEMLDGERPETLLNPDVWEHRRTAESALSRT
jgi:D-3-phosphoglycerate dehydrogenase